MRILFVLLLYLANISISFPQSIEIITTDEFVFDRQLLGELGVHAIYNIDEFERADRALNEALPTDEAAARKLADVRLPAHQEALATSFRAGLIIHRLKLVALPAIVFSKGEAVYYGANIREAIRLWEQHETK